MVVGAGSIHHGRCQRRLASQIQGWLLPSTNNAATCISSSGTTKHLFLSGFVHRNSRAANILPIVSASIKLSLPPNTPNDKITSTCRFGNRFNSGSITNTACSARSGRRAISSGHAAGAAAAYPRGSASAIPGGAIRSGCAEVERTLRHCVCYVIRLLLAGRISVPTSERCKSCCIFRVCIAKRSAAGPRL